MSYIDDVELATDETILIRARKSMFVFFDSAIYMIAAVLFIVCLRVIDPAWFANLGLALRVIIAAAPLLIALIVLIEDIVSYASLEIAVTNKRMLGKDGLVALTVLNIPLNNVTNIKVEMSMFSRICGYGKLTILTPSGDFVFTQISDPMAVQQTANNAMIK